MAGSHQRQGCFTLTPIFVCETRSVKVFSSSDARARHFSRPPSSWLSRAPAWQGQSPDEAAGGTSLPRCSSVVPAATRGATQFLYWTFFCSLQQEKVSVCQDSGSPPPPPPPPAQPRALSDTTALRERSTASSGSSPSSDLTIDSGFIFHVTHGTAKGMHCSRRTGLRSKVASISKRGVLTACTVGLPSLCSCASVFTGSRGSPPNRRSLAPLLPAHGTQRRVPFSLLWIRGFSCPQRERGPVCQHVAGGAASAEMPGHDGSWWPGRCRQHVQPLGEGYRTGDMHTVSARGSRGFFSGQMQTARRWRV